MHYFQNLFICVMNQFEHTINILPNLLWVIWCCLLCAYLVINTPSTKYFHKNLKQYPWNNSDIDKKFSNIPEVILPSLSVYFISERCPNKTNVCGAT